MTKTESGSLYVCLHMGPMIARLTIVRPIEETGNEATTERPYHRCINNFDPTSHPRSLDKGYFYSQSNYT